MSNTRVAAATDNMQPLLVRLTIDRQVTVDQAAAIENALRRILGCERKPAKIPTYKVTKTPATGKGPAREYKLAWTSPSGHKSRRVYQTHAGLISARDRLGVISPDARGVQLQCREVGLWGDYDGDPVDHRQYRVRIIRDGWQAPKVLFLTARPLAAALARNADADVQVQQRDILSRWVVIASDLKAVA